MESNLKQVVYFRKEEQEHGFIIEKVKDYYKQQKLVKRLIDRYAFSYQNCPRVFTDEELNKMADFWLYRGSEVTTQLEIDGDTKPWIKPTKKHDFENQYLGFRAILNGASVNTMPARTCVTENGDFDTAKAIELIDRTVHCRTKDKELKDIHDSLMEMPMFKSNSDNVVSFLLRDFRSFDKFKASVSALEYFGILFRENYAMKLPSKDLQNSNHCM